MLLRADIRPQGVKQALALDGVANVDVRIDDGAVAVDHEARISTGRLIAALEQAGYEASPGPA